MSKLKTPQKIEISQEWARCEIDGGTNINKKTRLTVLRNKLKKHFESNAHKSSVQILDNKDKNMLSKLMEEKDYQINKATHSIFRTAYYIAKYNRPFDDHLKLVQLQELNGIKLGITLHSRHSSTNIIQHISKEMKHKIIKNIIDTNAKCSILIDESTTLSALCSMVVYLKVSISNNEPIFIFLDLVELKNQTAENIVSQLINCLHTSGLDENYLQQHWVSFVSDGASVLLGKKNGVAKKLKDKYPLIFSWHCMNHRLELAVNDSLKDVSATNHFKCFIDSLYVLYNGSPKNQTELREICHDLDVLFLKIGRVLSVRWVASSWRAVNVVWKIFPALYNHLYTASNDSNRDSKTKNKYIGLLKKLASPEFVNDLAIMCDVLQELSNLSIELQSRTITLMQAEQSIKRCIRVITSFKINNGDYMHQAEIAIKDMKFKNIDLTSNKKMISINKNQFLTSIENNLQSRLFDNDGENKIILKNILVLEKSTWPEDPDIRYGEDDIKYLCKRFSLDQDEAISGMRKIIYDQTIDPKDVMPAFYTFLKTFPCSTAECERGFSVMNNICTDLRSRLTINNIYNLMFININGPPLSDWYPEDYVKSWLFNHRCAEDTRTKIARYNIDDSESKVVKKSLWKIL